VRQTRYILQLPRPGVLRQQFERWRKDSRWGIIDNIKCTEAINEAVVCAIVFGCEHYICLHPSRCCPASRQIIILCVVETEDFTLSRPRGINVGEFRNYNMHEIRLCNSKCKSKYTNLISRCLFDFRWRIQWHRGRRR